MQIRHNLVVGEKPFFRRGSCVLKTAHHLEKDENIGFFGMRRLRLGSALAGALGCLALSVAVCAALWPHAREAGAILAAQDDPAALSDIQHQFRPAEQSGAGRRKYRGGARGRRFRSRQQLRRTRPRQGHCRRRRTVEARQRCRHRRRFGVAFCQTLCHRSGDRQRRRRREPVGHGRRRSLRVRRHQGRGARGQASGDGRGGGPAGAGPCDGGPRGDRGDLRLRRRRRPAARRPFAWSRMPARSGGWARG